MRRPLLLGLLLLPLLSSCGRGEAPVRVFAAASLTDAMQELLATYAGDPWELNSASSLQLRRQIERGAAADLFVSAAAGHMDALESADLLDPTTRLDLLGNALVLIAPESGPPAVFGDPASGLEGTLRLALGDEGVPVGDYARAALRSLGLEPSLRGRVVPLPDEPSVLRAVARGAVERGIVYRSSVSGERARFGVRVLAELPPSSHPTIVYPVAVMADAPHPEAARRLLEHLRSETASTLFRRHGFRPLAEER